MTEQPEITYEVINDSEVEIEGDVKAPPPPPTPPPPSGQTQQQETPSR